MQGDASEAELPEIVTPQNLGRMWASSMGLSFAVPADVDVLAVTAGWGRYDQRETEDEDGQEARAGRASRWRNDREVRLDGGSVGSAWAAVDDPELPGVQLAVDVRPRDGRRVVQLALINAQWSRTQRDTAWLFQSG